MLRSRWCVVPMACTGLVLWIWLGFQLGVAHADEGQHRIPGTAERYEPGPLSAQASGWLELPTGGEEWLALSVLAALLLGLRYTDLGRSGGHHPS